MALLAHFWRLTMVWQEWETLWGTPYTGFTSWNPTRFLWLRAKKDPVSVLALKEKLTSGKYTRSILHDKEHSSRRKNFGGASCPQGRVFLLLALLWTPVAPTLLGSPKQGRKYRQWPQKRENVSISQNWIPLRAWSVMILRPRFIVINIFLIEIITTFDVNVSKRYNYSENVKYPNKSSLFFQKFHLYSRLREREWCVLRRSQNAWRCWQWRFFCGAKDVRPWESQDILILGFVGALVSIEWALCTCCCGCWPTSLESSTLKCIISFYEALEKNSNINFIMKITASFYWSLLCAGPCAEYWAHSMHNFIKMSQIYTDCTGIFCF